MSKVSVEFARAADGGKERRSTGDHLKRREGRTAWILAWVYSRLNFRSVAKLTRQAFFSLGSPSGFLLQQFCGNGFLSGESHLACAAQSDLTEEGKLDTDAKLIPF